jgi:hypothetical protein
VAPRSPPSKNSAQDATESVSQAKDSESKSDSDDSDNTHSDDSIVTQKLTCPASFSTATMTPEQAAFLRVHIGNIKKTNHAVASLKPIDPVPLNLPMYLEKVEHPTDLGAMTTKLRGSEYLSVKSFYDDLQLIVDNAGGSMACSIGSRTRLMG